MIGHTCTCMRRGEGISPRDWPYINEKGGGEGFSL